ncbi:ABC transporter permease subunit [Halorientalis pallida]|uniref:ABC transporter permease n=1 Tax=Halorientalis pallida TaxID=2479928 RepID=A0A498KTZ1_9EURY|nr:ABC transporter permease subunit [Halorientalis pallida]RXK48422.1 ABC transporter permease [Halorientalis pallida]
MRDHQLVTMARKDFDDAIRSKTVWALSGALALIAIFATFRVSQAQLPQGFPQRFLPVLVLGGLTQWISWIVCILALIAGYVSIVGERRTGSIKLLLGLPFERAEILVGKVLGRTAVIGVGIAAGFLTMIASILVLVGLTSPLDFLWRFVGMFLATVLLGGVYTTLSVSTSAIVSTRRRAVMAVVALFVVTQAIWTGITQFFYSVFAGGAVPLQPPSWYLFLTYLSPSAAYSRVVSLVVPIARYPGLGLDGVPRRAVQAQQSGAFYLSEYFALLVLLVWVVGSVLVAHSVFRNADLG